MCWGEESMIAVQVAIPAVAHSLSSRFFVFPLPRKEGGEVTDLDNCRLMLICYIVNTLNSIFIYASRIL